MNFSVQLSEKTFGPYRVYVPKDVAGIIQCEKFFRNSTADKSFASTLPSGLFEAFKIRARGADKTPQGIPMKPAHERVHIRARGEQRPKAAVRPCRANQGRVSVQSIIFEPKWLRIPSLRSFPPATGPDSAIEYWSRAQPTW